jgi:DNA-binding transcriptional regulator YdaS (Cro superfamily)
MEDGLKLAIEAAGGIRALARLLGITHQAVLAWKKVPAERLLEIEKLTGIARERLRPDLYRLPPDDRRRR